MTKVYQQCLKEWAKWHAQEGAQNNAISVLKLATFSLTYLGLDWHSVPLVFIILLFLLFYNHIFLWDFESSNHFKLMHRFYLQCPPPSCKWFDSWDVDHLLSLLVNYALAFSISTFKLAWKIATLSACVTAKHCSDLALLHIDNQHLFCSIMLLFLFQHLVVRWID